MASLSQICFAASTRQSAWSISVDSRTLPERVPWQPNALAEWTVGKPAIGPNGYRTAEKTNRNIRKAELIPIQIRSASFQSE